MTEKLDEFHAGQFFEEEISLPLGIDSRIRPLNGQSSLMKVRRVRSTSYRHPVARVEPKCLGEMMGERAECA